MKTFRGPSEQGFGHHLALFVLIVFAVFGGAFYYVHQKQADKTSKDGTAVSDKYASTGDALLDAALNQEKDAYKLQASFESDQKLADQANGADGEVD